MLRSGSTVSFAGCPTSRLPLGTTRLEASDISSRRKAAYRFGPERSPLGAATANAKPISVFLSKRNNPQLPALHSAQNAQRSRPVRSVRSQQTMQRIDAGDILRPKRHDDVPREQPRLRCWTSRINLFLPESRIHRQLVLIDKPPTIRKLPRESDKIDRQKVQLNWSCSLARRACRAVYVDMLRPILLCAPASPPGQTDA